MTDPRKAKSLGEAALNPDGTYNGIPVELEHDAVVLVHAGNVPLLSAESVNACETKPDS